MRRSRPAALILTIFLALGLPGQAQTTDPAALEHGTFGPFMRSLNDRPYGYAVIPDPTGSAPTPMVERFEVRPGDCGAHSSWDDCATDRERSELSERQKTTKSGDEHWYGWSVYFPADFVDVFPTKVTLGGFRQVKSHVIWRFQLVEHGYTLKDHVYGRDRRTHPVIPETELRGRWHRIEVQAKWSHGSDGFLRVWVNGRRKVDYAGRTMTADVVYFKYGVYRSALSRYKKANGANEVPAQTVLYANVSRAASRDGLLPPNPGIAN